MIIRQGRIKEINPDKAAIRIRDKYNEYKGKLHLKKVPWLTDYIEYQIEITEVDKNGITK